MVFLGAETSILGGSGDQSKRVHAYQDYFWSYKNAPRNLLLQQPGTENTYLRNGGSVTCLKASQTSVRGGHPQRLRLDEIDEMDEAIYDAAQGKTMESTLRNNGVKPQTVASSTHQHADGTMTKALAFASERGFPVYEWCYRESMTEWLTQEMVDTKRKEMTAEMWRTEVELGEPSIGNRAIQTESVEAMFDAQLGIFEGAPDQYIELEEPILTCEHGKHHGWTLRNGVVEWSHYAQDEDATGGTVLTYSGKNENPCCVCCPSIKAPEWVPFDADGKAVAPPVEHVERRYSTGADWAKERDWTIISTWRIDVVPRRLVAYLRIGRKPWPLMVGKLDERMHRYPGACMYDQTGIGNVVRDLLTVRVTGFVLTGANEDSLLSEFISAVERGDYKCPRIRHPYSEHKYATMDAIYGSDHLPDTICANALAHRAAKKGRRAMLPA